MGRKESNQEIERFIKTDSEVSNSVLDLARNEIKSNTNQNKKKQKKIVGISVPILISMLLFLLILPISLESAGFIKSDFGESNSLKFTYEDLTKIVMEPVKDYNEEYETSMLWIHEAEILNTYQLLFKDEKKLIEEHYKYKDVDCVLLISDKKIEFTDCEYVITTYSNLWENDSIVKLKWTVLETKFYGNMLHNSLHYYIRIDTEDKGIIKEVLSNFM